MLRAISLVLTAVALFASPAALAAADESASQPAPADQTPTRASLTLQPVPGKDSIDDRLEQAFEHPAGLLPFGPVSLIDPAVKILNDQLDKVGLKVGFAYTAVFQAASNGPGTRTAAGGDADFFGNWRLLGSKDDPNKGLLYFAMENRHDLGTGIAPNALGGQIGSLWPTTNGFGEQVFTVKELYWQQHIQKDLLVLRIGKLDPENYYNSNYWQSDSLYFLNSAFSSFPVRAFPGQGLGLNITSKPADFWYISAGVQDAQGKKTTSGFNTLFGDHNLFSAFEIGLTPTIPNWGKGTYRFTPWYRDAGESNGKPYDTGFDISIDQRIGEHFIPFFRWGIGKGNINGIEDMISTGLGWQGKLLTPSDVVGLGGAWGRPSNHSLRDQFATEIFYRLQVSPDNQFTIGYQLIVDPSNAPTTDAVGVFELRWRITF